MNKIKRRTVAITAGLFLSLSTLCGVLSANKKVESAEAIGNYSTDASTYYNGITATSGKQLAAQLHDLITSTHRYYTSYADNGANGYQKQTDQYYENGSKVSGYIYEFYSGVKWPNAWAATAGNTSGGYNREHCWCQSNSVNAGGTQMWGESGGGADMHHLRPVEVRLNSTRSNNEYGELTNRDSYKVYAKYGTNTTYALGGYNNNGTFEPLDSKKGDVARIILYTYLHYNSYKISDLFGSYGTTNGSGTSSYFSTTLLSVTKITNKSTESAALAMLLDWNTSDPVDDIERRRNEQVATYQGNRNPFIDDSTYADKIWGSGSPTPTVNSVSVSPSTLNLDLNGTTTGNLTATVTVSNDAPTTVTWTSSNTNVATVSSSGVVTAVAKGSCSITATSTYNSNKSASCSVKVVDTSGGGGGGGTASASQRVVSKSNSTYFETGSIYLTGSTTSGSASCDAFIATQTKVSGSTSVAYTYDEIRVYANHSFMIAPNDGYTITSVVITANSSSYASAVGGTSFTNCSNSVDGSIVTLTPTDGTSTLGFQNAAQSRLNYVTVNYEYESSSGDSPLDSISLNTSNVLTEFYVGDTFDYSGLIVTAHYENGTEDIVTPSSVSSPNMSTVGNKTVTVTYSENDVTKTATYTISVLSADITAIYASVNKTFHPGESITTSDIYVEDNLGNEVTGFEFNDDGYVFTYTDAPSGGSESEKTFEDSVSYSSFTCDLEVTVSRVAYVTPLTKDDTMTRSWTGVSSTQYTAWSNKTGTSGATYAGQSAGPTSGTYANTIQLRSNNSNSGIVTTAYSGSLYISSITVSWNSNTADDRTLNIYGDTTAYTSPTQLYGNSIKGTLLGTITKSSGSSLTITGSYQYIGIRSASNALYLDQIVVTYGTPQSPTNVSNYIMYEDTNAQCTTKFGIAKGYFEDLSASERNTFMTSDDYVISTARTRLEAWARYHGKVITTSDGDYVITDARNPVLNIVLNSNNNTILIVIVVTTLSLLSIGGYFFLKKKKEI